MDNNIEELYDKVSPGQINLRSFEEKEELQKDIWNSRGIRPEIRRRLLEIAQEFISTLELDYVYPEDIVVVGSIAGYNWSKYSDVDLHVLYDFRKVGSREKIIKNYFDSMKNQWNGKHGNIEIKGYPVELYVQDVQEENESDGVYSLRDDRWIRMPRVHDYKLNKKLICSQASKLINLIMEIDGRLERASGDTEALRNIDTEINVLYKFIVQGRRSGLASDGESSPENIVFKVLRRSGHLGHLRDMKNYVFDVMNSI